MYIQEAGCWIQDCGQAQPGLDITSFMREKYSSDRSNCGGDVKSQFSRGVVSRISQCFWQSNDLLGWSCCAINVLEQLLSLVKNAGKQVKYFVLMHLYRALWCQIFSSLVFFEDCNLFPLSSWQSGLRILGQGPTKQHSFPWRLQSFPLGSWQSGLQKSWAYFQQNNIVFLGYRLLLWVVGQIWIENLGLKDRQNNGDWDATHHVKFQRRRSSAIVQKRKLRKT